MTEKVDGVRAYWNGQELLSKSGNQLPCPRWFIEKIPKDSVLDGELVMGRGMLQNLFSLLHMLPANPDYEKLWKTVSYVVFDMPQQTNKSYLQRMEDLDRLQLPLHVHTIPTLGECLGNEHLVKCLTVIKEQGGEGLMLIDPNSSYQSSRVSTLLKVKVYLCIFMLIEKPKDESRVRVLEILPTGLYCLQCVHCHIT